jgi:hypothetical protein
MLSNHAYANTTEQNQISPWDSFGESFDVLGESLSLESLEEENLIKEGEGLEFDLAARISQIEIFQSPKSHTDPELQQILKIGRFSTHSRMRGGASVIISDIAIEFSSAAAAQAAYGTVSLMSLRDHVLNFYIQAADTPYIQISDIDEGNMRYFMLPRFNNILPEIEDIHIIKISRRDVT